MSATLTLKLNPNLQFQLRCGVLWHRDHGTTSNWAPTEYLFAGEEGYDLKVVKEIERFFRLTVIGVEKRHKDYTSDFTLVFERSKNGRRKERAGPCLGS